jgi:hypothetical protein
MFAQDYGMNRGSRDSHVLGNERAQSRAIENRARTDYSAGRQPRNSRGQIGHYIHRVRLDDQHSVGRGGNHFGHHLAEYGGVTLH